MKNFKLLFMSSICIFILFGCAKTEKSEALNVEINTLFDQFEANEIPLYYSPEVIGYEEESYYLADLTEPEWSEVKGERLDLDNDGELEMIITDFYCGGRYLDVRDGRIYVFAEGEGTAAMINHLEYEGKEWIYHSDTTHGGRTMYYFDLYQGKDIIDSFDFLDEYWDGEDKEHTYTYRGNVISKDEYDQLYQEIFHGSDKE